MFHFKHGGEASNGGSQTDQAPLVRLSVRPRGAPAEVLLLDGNFRVIASEFGTLDTEVPPGVYKVRIRAGLQMHEEHILVRGDQPLIETTYDPLAFSSAAPLYGTAKWRKDHAKAAKGDSGGDGLVEHIRAGQGSWIFVCARDSVHPEDAAELVENPRPLLGLTLRRLTGELVADFETNAGVVSRDGPYQACNVAVDPGTYLLSLQLSQRTSLQQTIVAAPGWQTQVFLLQREYPPSEQTDFEKIRRADLVMASIFMSHPPGFDDRSAELGLVELTRHALTYPRRLVREEVIKQLQAGSQDPMLGLFGAHLLYTPEEERYSDLPQKVARELGDRLGMSHPDLEAIAVRAGKAERVKPFTAPPMLLRSWGFICKATAERPELVPAQSLIERVADRLWGDGPWLVWHESTKAEKSVSRNEAEYAVAAAVTLFARKQAQEQPEAAAWATPIINSLTEAFGPTFSISASLSTPPGGVHALAASVGQAYQKVVGALSSRWTSGPQASAELPLSAVNIDPAQALQELRASFNSETVSRLVQAVGLPRGKIERLLDDLESRLKRDPKVLEQEVIQPKSEES